MPRKMPDAPPADETVGDRVRRVRTKRGMSQAELSRLSGLKQPTISSLEQGKSNTSGAIASIADALGVDALWLETGLGDETLGKPMFRRTHGGESTPEYEIDVAPSEGSCGGGAVGRATVDELREMIAPVIKDQRFFDRFKVAPKDTFAVIADGFGMSNVIEHGDLVVFNRNSKKLTSGAIYAFETSAGTRIKRVHRRTDGNVILSCDSPDKHRYPDEIYLEAEAALLRVLGEHFYREG